MSEGGGLHGFARKSVGRKFIFTVFSVLCTLLLSPVLADVTVVASMHHHVSVSFA